MPHPIPMDLKPPEIVATELRLSKGQWRAYATALVAVGEAMVGVVGAALALTLGPIGVVLAMDPALSQWVRPIMGTLAVGIPAVSVAALAGGEVVRRRWAIRRRALSAQVASWSLRITDPRWTGAVGLLRELRGTDRDGTRARTVYALARALGESFDELRRIDAAVAAGDSVSREGGDRLRAIRAQRDQALSGTLTGLKEACADALSSAGGAEQAAGALVDDLQHRLRASAEIEGVRPTPRQIPPQAVRT